MMMPILHNKSCKVSHCKGYSHQNNNHSLFSYCWPYN